MKQASCLASSKIRMLMIDKQQVITSFYTDDELLQIGFKSVGKNVKLSRKASIYSPQSISIGDNVRIDDFCILSGNITIGSNVHISAYVALYGAMGIVIEDYSGISPKSVVYSAMDDFSGEYLIGPIHPTHTTNVTGGVVTICRYVQIGSNTVVFPNLTIGEGAVIGACSLVRNNIKEWSVNYGIPAKKYKARKKTMLRFIDEANRDYINDNQIDKTLTGGGKLSLEFRGDSLELGVGLRPAIKEWRVAA